MKYNSMKLNSMNHTSLKEGVFMNKFIGRRNELEALEHFYEKEDQGIYQGQAGYMYEETNNLLIIAG